MKKEILINNYLNIRNKLGHIPSIFEMAQFSSYSVSLYLKEYGSWYNFLKSMNNLNSYQNYSPLILNFFEFIEKTKMTKSYKMGLLLAIFEEENNIKKIYSLQELAVAFKEKYKNPLFSKDFYDKKFYDLKNWKIKNYEKLILSYPIHYLTENNKNSDFFIFKNNLFIFNTEIYEQLKNNNLIIHVFIVK